MGELARKAIAVCLGLLSLSLAFADTSKKHQDPKAPLLSPAHWEALWQDLASADADKSYRAMNTLLDHPDEAVRFLRQRMRPADAADPERVRQLVEDLDHAKFSVRYQAMRDLEKWADFAQPAFSQALANQASLEMFRRIELLYERMDRLSGL